MVTPSVDGAHPTMKSVVDAISNRQIVESVETLI
jgi:hypothetical protein